MKSYLILSLIRLQHVYRNTTSVCSIKIYTNKLNLKTSLYTWHVNSALSLSAFDHLMSAISGLSSAKLPELEICRHGLKQLHLYP